MNTRRKSSILPRISITATKIGSTDVDIISFIAREEKCIQEYKTKRKSVKFFNDEHCQAKYWITTGRVCDAATNAENLEKETGPMASNIYNQPGTSNSKVLMKDNHEAISKQNAYESNAVRNGKGSSNLEIPVDELIKYKGKNKGNKSRRKTVVRFLERPERKLATDSTKIDAVSPRSETNNLYNLPEVVINVERLSDETVSKKTIVLNEKRESKDKGKKTQVKEGDEENSSTSACSTVTNPIRTEKQAKNRSKRQPAKRLKKEEHESRSEDVPYGTKKRENIRRLKGSTGTASPMNLKGRVKEERQRESRTTVKNCDQKKVSNGKIKMESTVGFRRSQRIKASLSSMCYRK